MDRRDSEFRKKLLTTFKLEAAEHVQALSTGLIELEKAPAAGIRMEVVETVFREAHSLKGAARAVGLAEIESLCQSAESVFSLLKREELSLSPALFDVLHDTVDAIGEHLQGAEDARGKEGKPGTQDVLRRLAGVLKGKAILAGESGKRSKNAVPAHPETGPARSLPPERTVLADTVRIATARLDRLLFQVEGLLSAKLTASRLAGEIGEAESVLAPLKKKWANVAPSVKAMRRASETAGKRDDRGGTGLPSREIAEVVAWQDEFARSFADRITALRRSAERDYRSLATMVDGLLEDMKKALMLPMSSGLEILPKFARDLCRDRSKAADLLVRGGEIEIDRRILEAMRDPFIHLVRNSIDHGIETPDERKRKNKSPRGKIAITVAQKDGSSIEILVSDDGAGIDLGKLGQAAAKLGVLSRDTAGGRDGRELLPLIFQSGISTSPIVTDISGRGLGLAIVRQKVESLGGEISVESRSDEGTVFRIVLPLTLATFRGVQVRVNEHLLVLPTTRIEQVARLKRDTIKTVENRETIQWDGQAVALARLSDVLELPRKAARGARADMVPVVVLGSAEQRIAFEVDEILDEREVLVKPLGRQLPRVRNIAGATVLGTGKAVPILDIPDLLKSAVRNAGAPSPAAIEAPETPIESKTVLVAEDSITSRTLLRNILESAGYRVSTAVDGADAFSLLKTERFDLLVSDVDMPRMSGFDLTAKIRADKGLAELPVVLVTALGSRGDRERGIDAGANAYIVKSSFDQSNLLEVVRRLL